MIEIHSSGLIDEDEIEKSMREIMSINEKTGVNKVLVDASKIKELPNTIGLFSLFSEYPYHIKTALMAIDNDSVYKDLRFVESVALNRGKKVQAFYRKEDALKWLNES